MESHANEIRLIKGLPYYKLDHVPRSSKKPLREHLKRLSNILYADEAGESAMMSIEIDKKGLAEKFFGSSKIREKSPNEKLEPKREEQINDFPSIASYDEL